MNRILLQSQGRPARDATAPAAPTPPAAPQAPSGGERVIVVPDGKGGQTRIVMGGEGGLTVNREGVPAIAPAARRSNDIPDGVVDIVQALAAMVAFVFVGGPLARAFARRVDQRGSAQPRTAPEVMQRLASIEQAVEAVAVEVERISEGQRFTTKLLSDRTKVEAERV